MSDWLEAEQARKDAWTAYSLTGQGTAARRAAAVVFAEACERLDNLDNGLTVTP